MTNIESFEDRFKANQFAKDYAQQHRVMTRIVRQDNSWTVRVSERRHGPTQLQPQPEQKPQQTPSPTIDTHQLPTEEKQRLSHFVLVEQLLALDKPEERERRLEQLCTTWGGRLVTARKILREMFNQQDEPKKLSGRLRRRLRSRGILQFDYHLSAARRCAQSACQTADIPHFAAVGKHIVRGDFWVFVDTLPRHGNPVDLIEIYRKSDSRTGWWCERLSTPTYISTWDVEMRDPATGDILHVHRRGINGKSVALRVLSETPNFELVDVVEADADWAEAVPYDTIEAVVADSEDEEKVQTLLAD
jgi:hypothetical protein